MSKLILFAMPCFPAKRIRYAVLACLGIAIFLSDSVSAEENVRSIGVAKIDITPDYPIRLSGYGLRREESEGVDQKLWAKALAIGSDEEGPAVIVTIDNCGIPASMRKELLARLTKKTAIRPEALALCFSHTHSGPCLKGALPNIFSSKIPENHQKKIDRYSAELTDLLEKVVFEALADRRPGTLSRSEGEVTFARNRRYYWGGPVDWSLPALFVHGKGGSLRAIFATYACHAVTRMTTNRISGDWPGYAMAAIERDHPGVVAMISIGCGADQNPIERETLEAVQNQGNEIAAEIQRILPTAKPLVGAVECRTKEIELSFATPRTKEEWEKRAQSPKAYISYHAQKNFDRLTRGEAIPTEIPYLVQTWNFGDDLAMVFLPGEVVVDYAFRLRNEFDAERLWIHSYSNAATCYIPSQRVLKEGGYEGFSAMIYYDRPEKFADGVEKLVVSAVSDLVPETFRAQYHSSTPPPKTPAGSLAALETKPGFVADLAVCEPLVSSPVAIDWGADGRLWVVEMRDYPSGPKGNFEPGGNVKVLSDKDGDGRYDTASVFLDNLSFPTGVTAWGKGVLICAAPDIIYAEDTDGDDRADKVQTLYSGFYTDNYQARVNSLYLGLDNWIHGASGLLGGEISPAGGRLPAWPGKRENSQAVSIQGHDFRFHPRTGMFQVTSGVTQQGMARDDWGNRFGCSNGSLGFHFPIAERYIARNPHIATPATKISIGGPDQSMLYPASEGGERYNNPDAQNHVTSGCGLGVYRARLLPDSHGDLFTCEPVHNLVHRMRITPKSATFSGSRVADEKESEFLRSTDSWFRPVQVRTGPDGALWVVDMYRAVIEHPRWIPADKLAKLDVRAGAEKGRIYRIFPEKNRPRAIPNYEAMDVAQLAAAMADDNGTARDSVHGELLRRGDETAVAPLEKIALENESPEIRLQALCALDGIGALSQEILAKALTDSHASVRRHAIRLSEPNLAACLPLANDPDIGVRYQLALSLGEWDDPRAAETLAALAREEKTDAWLRAAVLSSSQSRALAVLEALEPQSESGMGETIAGLISTAAGGGENLDKLAPIVAGKSDVPIQGWQIMGLNALETALQNRKEKAKSHSDLDRVYQSVHEMAWNNKAAIPVRLAALRLYGRGCNDPKEDFPKLAKFLAPGISPSFQNVALETLARSSAEEVPDIVLAGWKLHGPALRTTIVDTLLGRSSWTGKLLDAVESKTVSAADIPTASRERLVKHEDESIRNRAETLLPSTSSANRAAVVAEYAPVKEMKGDAAKGAQTFQNLCSTCHAYLGNGHDVGPNVGTFRDKEVQDFLVAILDPNSVVEPRYSTYTAKMKDGRTLFGIVSSETAASLVLSQPGGVSTTLLRSEIESLETSPLSLMPEGLDAAIPPQDMANLIAYLKGSR